MDSINRNQPEHNREDLSGQAAVNRIKEVVDKNGTCFFCTAAGDAIAGIKMLVGAAIGKTLDDSIEGRVTL